VRRRGNEGGEKINRRDLFPRKKKREERASVSSASPTRYPGARGKEELSRAVAKILYRRPFPKHAVIQSQEKKGKKEAHQRGVCGSEMGSHESLIAGEKGKGKAQPDSRLHRKDRVFFRPPQNCLF